MNTWYEIDVKSQITGDATVSFALESASTNGADYRSREAGAGWAPRRNVSRGSSIEFETRWGGLGGAGGGWRLSSSFSYLLASLLFGGLFASTVWALLRTGEPQPLRPSATATAPKDSSAKR